MSARDIESLWCDDITFCSERCERLDCPRNKENIRDKTVPHSYSVEIPSDCPKKESTDYVEEEIVRHEWKENVDYISRGQILVRCKNCIYMYEVTDGVFECEVKAGYFPVTPDWFCADGERK